MKLNEVAGSALKCALVVPAHDRSIDADDWHGSTEIYTSQSEFMKYVRSNFIESNSLEGEEADAVQKMTWDQIQDHEYFDDFIEAFWIDYRF